MTTLLFILASIFFVEDFSSKQSAMTDWLGTWEQLTITAHEQLRNNVDYAAESYLMRSSVASVDAEWSFYTRIYGGTSAYNMVRFYILTADSLSADGYYVQVGGNNDNITLYHQQKGVTNKVIESDERKKILSDDDAEVYVRLTRGQDGVFHLYSLVENTDADYVLEGTCRADWLSATWVALWMKNSAKRGYTIYMDDISVSGEQQSQPLPAETATDVQLSLSDDCLSLHHEGHEAEVSIAYSCPEDTYRATLNVYSADGRLIRTCCEAIALEGRGQLTWNGRDNHGADVQIGVYVLILEITSSQHPTIRKRYPIAVLH